MLRITLAVLHLLALGIGFGAINLRRRAAGIVAAGGDRLRDVFEADTFWGISAMLWISTGLWRWLAGIEKTRSYYTSSHVFLTKMGLLLLILVLEIWPMITLIRLRAASARGSLPAPAVLADQARRIALISRIQAILLVGMVIAATMMARGYGAP